MGQEDNDNVDIYLNHICQNSACKANLDSEQILKSA